MLLINPLPAAFVPDLGTSWPWPGVQLCPALLPIQPLGWGAEGQGFLWDHGPWGPDGCEWGQCPCSGCKWHEVLPAVSPLSSARSSGTGRCPLSSFSSQALGGFGVSVNKVEADFEPHGTGTAMPGEEQTSFGWLQLGKLTLAVLLVGGLLCHPPCAHTCVPLLGRRKVAHGTSSQPSSWWHGWWSPARGRQDKVWTKAGLSKVGHGSSTAPH